MEEWEEFGKRFGFVLIEFDEKKASFVTGFKQCLTLTNEQRDKLLGKEKYAGRNRRN